MPDRIYIVINESKPCFLPEYSVDTAEQPALRSAWQVATEYGSFVQHFVLQDSGTLDSARLEHAVMTPMCSHDSLRLAIAAWG